MIEYWDSDTLEFPTQKVSFQMKSTTDLYDLLKAKTTACSISSSPSGDSFVIMARDKIIRLFGKLYISSLPFHFTRKHMHTHFFSHSYIHVYMRVYMYVYIFADLKSGKLRRKYDESIASYSSSNSNDIELGMHFVFLSLAFTLCIHTFACHYLLLFPLFYAILFNARPSHCYREGFGEHSCGTEHKVTFVLLIPSHLSQLSFSHLSQVLLYLTRLEIF